MKILKASQSQEEFDYDGGPMVIVYCIDCGKEGEQQNPPGGFEWTCGDCK